LYRPVRTGLAADRYADRSLPGGTAKIGRRQSISTVGGRLREKSTVDGRLRKKGKRKKKKKKKNKRKRTRRREEEITRPCDLVARGQFFSRGGERDRGDVCRIGLYLRSRLSRYCTIPSTELYA
ncbi:hypothetical protein GW17_00056854, partial [Ensete ventricosum]